jgi:hypothetical protein
MKITVTVPVLEPRSNIPLMGDSSRIKDMKTPAKRKVSVTLDADLVAAVEADSSTTMSAVLNSALRAEFAARKRQQALADLLDRLADERGRLDTPEDEAEITRYMSLLGGQADDPGELQAS